MPEASAPLGVLVVDDEPDLAGELVDGLSVAGFRAMAAHSGREASDILARDPGIGVILTDVGMPGDDGFALARHILAAARPEHARRVVIMTGNSRVEHASAALRAGAFDYLRKPFDLDAVLDVVPKAMASARAERLEHARTRHAAERLAHAEAERETLRMNDPVTGLPNALALEAALHAGTDARTALLMLRLDGLKFVHAAGSRALHNGLLAAAARRFAMACDGHGLFALHEPAHFAVLAREMDQPGAVILGEALVAALRAPLIVDGQEAALIASVGLTVGSASRQGTTPDACAQVAMAEAQRQGGGRVVTFSREMHGIALRRLRITQDLPRAIADGQLALHYQPLRTPDLDRLLGFEALLRWAHPQLGPVRPDEFVAAAEETGTIVELGAWTARTAAAQASRWRHVGGKAPYVGVNVSGRQIRDADVAALFRDVMDEFDLPPSAFLVEITESVAVGEEASAVLDVLRASGLRIALDDFGAGFSSLGALRRLSVDVVKFDRALLPSGPREAEEARFFTSLVGAIRGLDFAVVSEGIETEAQRQLIARAGVDAAQGFLVGRPAPAGAAEAMVLGGAAMAASAGAGTTRQSLQA